ncbi:L-seryl-tRNA(Sec) selenium transferase [Bacillus massilinigeriensis]|uniref:L-seryl-tRNA(Sec) selenium transferase n=1 Tax=Bacillus massilionigeriensis TaxID=1805475 RepID=UPI00096AF6B1|nr:L-seryl-tRNA(Sec) selenium transferase [Bacillus massilionigeriensis]
MEKILRKIPPIHELQKNEVFQELMNDNGIELEQMTEMMKKIIEQIRESIHNRHWNGPMPGTGEFNEYIYNQLEDSIKKKFSFTLKRVINATGTILHTNFGRARLSEKAIEHVIEVAKNYSNLEYELEKGERGSRHSHVESLIKHMTGAEAAMVVNNNAAAVYLVLRALAKNREVLVSRGQLVEIGGSFRISSIMEESGAQLIEVGTTNKTHLHDYVEKISEETAMLLKVHTSNFKVIGFTKQVSTRELAELANKHQHIIFYEDLGSGVIYDFQRLGIGEEPVVSDVLKMGVDIVSFSGDKLLGGPQAGIIAGKKALIDQLKKHQLARVVRVDKMTLAALEGTLIDYLKGEEGRKNIPIIRDILITKEELKTRAEAFTAKLQSLNNLFITNLADGTSQVGGGTMPDVAIPSTIISLNHKRYSAEELARKLRQESHPSIIVRVQKESVYLDLRTVTEEDEEFILSALVHMV